MRPGAGLAGGVDDLGDGALLRLLRAGGQEPGVPWPGGRRGRVDRLGGPRRGRSAAPSKPATSAQRGLEARRRRAAGTPSTPECEQEALEAEDARLVQRPQVGEVAGHGAAPEADVDEGLPVGRPPAWPAGASTVVVGGMLLSGMSTIVVTPPAAAARVAVAKPSHSVRPGSLTCTWVSTRPGSRTSSSSRRTVSSPERAAPAELSGSTATIRPPLMPTAAGPSPPAVTARSARMRTSHLMAVSSRGRSSSRTG